MKKVLVTGGSGFLGKHLQAILPEDHKGTHFSFFSSNDCNLLYQDEVESTFLRARFDMVIHLAASVGGIGANQDNPGKYCYENLIMGCNIMEAARLTKVDKVICVGTVCSYPKYTKVPFKEEDLWKGYPEETNAPYGIAKKAILELQRGYFKQYGVGMNYLIPVNMYGEWDNFNPHSSHVIPALVDKVLAAKKAGERKIEVWGTGVVTREFVHASDVAKGISLALTRPSNPEPMNLGSGEEVKIDDLVKMIGEAADWKVQPQYTTDKPDGQPRRLISSEWAKDFLGYEPKVKLKEGLKNLVQWRIKNPVRHL